MSARLRDLTGYLVAVLAGVAYMATAGAPAAYIAINLVALGVGAGAGDSGSLTGQPSCSHFICLFRAGCIWPHPFGTGSSGRDSPLALDWSNQPARRNVVVASSDGAGGADRKEVGGGVRRCGRPCHCASAGSRFGRGSAGGRGSVTLVPSEWRLLDLARAGHHLAGCDHRTTGSAGSGAIRRGGAGGFVAASFGCSQ